MKKKFAGWKGKNEVVKFMLNILLIGSGAREHALARAIKKSPRENRLFCFGSSKNPGIMELSAGYRVGSLTDVEAMVNFAKENELPHRKSSSSVALAKEDNVDFAFIGPEAPLEAGLADELWRIGIPCVGPKKNLARIETSKSFARDLLTGRGIAGCPEYKYFQTMDGVKEFLEKLGNNFVIKADGLMGGKGVKVSGEHLRNAEEALKWCEELTAEDKTFLIEEKLVGPEFSLMSFCDGEHLAHMPAVQDHKRAFAGDTGPNTGGMGTYSDANHSLPFLTPADIATAQKLNEATARALAEECGEGYKGILYGGFMATANGVKLIEYNARLGDPEAMNVLAVLESDFVELCQAIIGGTLDKLSPPARLSAEVAEGGAHGGEGVHFAPKATVCKYAVPEGYPDAPVKNQKIDISAVMDKSCLYFGAVDAREDGLYETGSRTIAVLGVADTIEMAEKIAEAEIRRIKGPLFHREDIGTKELINKRVEMRQDLKTKKEPLKLAILGSTRGTNMEAIIQAIKSGELNAVIAVVVSNKSDAYILERAKNNNIPAFFIDSRGKTREEFDLEILRTLDNFKPDLVLLIGYMRILSSEFVRQYHDRILNVHPSLLPAFAGGMDLNVHEEVLKASVKETGCTVHLVDEGVDTGKILIQKKCAVEPDDTAATLKEKVQKLEGEALVEALRVITRRSSRDDVVIPSI